MTPRETRACRISFQLHNLQSSSTRSRGSKERPPFFFFGMDKLNGKLGEDQAVISLPLWPLLKYVRDMNEAIDELIHSITSIQDEGPYFLGGYCGGGYFAYEIARRLTSCGHRVALLALVESSGIGDDDRLLRITRRLLFSVAQPMELLSYLAAKLDKITRRKARNEEPNSNQADYFRESNRVLGDYWVRFRLGLPTYPGHLTLLYGDRSIDRCLPAHGWKDLVEGGIEVHTAKGDHFAKLFDNPDIFLLVRKCIDKALESLADSGS